jgi:hypothetical protein
MKTEAALRNVVGIGSVFDVLGLTWQQQCPHPTISAKAETSPAGAGKEGTPCCCCWPLDFFFLVLPQAHCITRCGR